MVILAMDASEGTKRSFKNMADLSGDPVLEWVKGTGLRPILEGLADREREAFLEDYGQRLRMAYPRRPDGRTLYPFRRLFIVATV